MRITLKQLKVFAAIAQHENMTVAAEQVALTQSAMSMALKEFESQLNKSLFDRHGKKMALNHTGRSLLPKVLQILHLAREIEYQAGIETLAGQIRIGASSTIGNYLAPKLIAEFLTDNPQIDIDLKVANTRQVIEDVLQFRLDIGLIEGLCDHPQIDRRVWLEDELVIVSGKTHAIVQQSHIRINDLDEENWILREQGSGTREIFTHAIQEHFQPKSVLEIGTSEAIKAAVKTGFGLSCLSKLTIETELAHGELIQVPLAELDLKRQFFIIKHRSQMSRDLVSAFEQKLQELKP